MALSSAGIGSGLDVNAIVGQLMNVEKQPLTLLQSKASTLQTKLSAYGSVKSALSKFQDASRALLDTSGWTGKTFTSSSSTAVSGNASASALASTFTVQVDSLAKAQSVRSQPFATGVPAGLSGSLQIELGAWSDTTFTTGSTPSVNVNIDDTDTLSDIATKINQGNAGIQAVVVSSSNGDQLLLRGQNPGAGAGFQIRAFDGPDGGGSELSDGVTGLGQLAFGNDGSNFFGLTQTQAATDAILQIDGIQVSSSSNTVSNAVPGITLNLLTTTSAPVTVSVADDKEAVKKRITDFQSAYNSLASTLKDLTKYDPGSKSAGALQGDSTAIGLQNVLRSMLGANGPSGTRFSRLTEVGLEVQRDGTMSLNTSKLDAALNSLPDLNAFFTASTGNSATDGMAKRLNTFIQQALGVDGNVAGRSKALQEAISRNSKDQSAISTRLSQRQAALYAQFNALDTKMGGLSSLSSFVSQQVSQWNKS